MGNNLCVTRDKKDIFGQSKKDLQIVKCESINLILDKDPIRQISLDQQYYERVGYLEKRMEHEDYQMQEMQELTKLYLEAIEFYQFYNDPIQLYFLDKIQQLIKRALNQENQVQNQNLFQKNQLSENSRSSSQSQENLIVQPISNEDQIILDQVQKQYDQLCKTILVYENRFQNLKKNRKSQKDIRPSYLERKEKTMNKINQEILKQNENVNLNPHIHEISEYLDTEENIEEIFHQNIEEQVNQINTRLFQRKKNQNYKKSKKDLNQNEDFVNQSENQEQNQVQNQENQTYIINQNI